MYTDTNNTPPGSAPVSFEAELPPELHRALGRIADRRGVSIDEVASECAIEGIKELMGRRG